VEIIGYRYSYSVEELSRGFYPSEIIQNLDMKVLLALCLLAVGVRLIAAAGNGNGGEKEDVGTVIGIDLGTTYSW